MENIKGKIEVAANVAIIVVAVLLCVVLLKSYVIPAPAARQSVGGPAGTRGIIKSGDAVAVSGVDWEKNGKTLLLVLSTTCHFCTQSGPFYQRLVKEHGDAKLVGLVPQSASEGQSYLKGLGVEVDDVRQASLGDLGVSGTPTLILVDGKGVAADIWVGALSPNRENEVVSRLSTERASR
ncbi:MAG TPA: thioredoxin family protein [Pyrinomonadaceae bacterium]